MWAFFNRGFSNRGGRGPQDGRNQQHGGFGRGGNSRSFTRPIFLPELKVCKPDKHARLNVEQKKMVTQLKINNGWSDTFTPLHGQMIDNSAGFPIPINQTRAVNQVNFSGVPLSPPPPETIRPPTTNHIPDAMHVPLDLVGSSFGRSNVEESKEDGSVANISRVTIDGRSFCTGEVFDSNG